MQQQMWILTFGVLTALVAVVAVGIYLFIRISALDETVRSVDAAETNAPASASLRSLETRLNDRIDSVQDDLRAMEDVIRQLDGGDELISLVDDLESRIAAADANETPDENLSKLVANLESRIAAVEAAQSTPYDDGEPAFDEEEYLSAIGGLLLQVFPELLLDDNLSSNCISGLRRFVQSPDRYGSEESQALLRYLQLWNAQPFSMMSNQMINDISNLMNELANRRGWIDWDSEDMEYRSYESGYDEDEVGPDAALPCLEDRGKMQLFSSIRSSNPMGNYRSEILEEHWQCVDLIIREEYDRSNDRRCRAFNKTFDFWLPALDSPFADP